MDPYERLAAINEALQEAMMGNKPKPKVKKENPVAKFSKAVAGIEKKSPEEVAAKLAAFYDKQDREYIRRKHREDRSRVWCGKESIERCWY
jgi:hypothetical protein